MHERSNDLTKSCPFWARPTSTTSEKYLSIMVSKLGPVSAMTGIGGSSVGGVVARRSSGKSDILKRSNWPETA
jgi:hypothetical protein